MRPAHLRIGLVVMGCLGLLLLLLMVAGVKPIDVIKSFIEGSTGIGMEGQGFKGWGALSELLRRCVPLIITGLAVFLGLQAGLFNIGAEGQLRIGGIAAIWAGLTFGIGGPLGILAACAAGVVAGLLWALPAGIIKAWRGGHEVITTIMLNNIAGHLTKYLIAGPMQAVKGGEAATKLLPEGQWLHTVGRQGETLVIYPALFVGLALCSAGSWWLLRTSFGFELRATGANPVAARFAGVNVKRMLLWAMCLSGAIAGLAGALHALGQEHRFTEGFSPGFGFDSLGVALLAGKTPLGVIPAALLFAFIDQGAVRSQIHDGLPKEVSAVIQGLVILVVAVIRWRKKVAE
jgi:ABC-type uncharacterized transport system permease subunit